jgi:hypothetical protein
VAQAHGAALEVAGFPEKPAQSGDAMPVRIAVMEGTRCFSARDP